MTETLILDELRRLQQQVAALQQSATRRHRVTLTPVQPQPWLGQAVTLWVRVTDDGGTQPRVDLPVLVTTTWGQLRVADGYTLQTGASIVARTDLNGAILMTLLPPLSEELGEPPQRALETLLAQFDPTAPTPQAMLSALNVAVAQYQQITEQELRAAIDFYFQHFYQPRLATLTAYDWLQSWQTINATVLALAPENLSSSGGTAGEALPLLAATVQGAAVLPLRFRDWLGPWLQCYTDLAREEAQLRQQFALLTELTQNPDELLAATTDLVQTAVRKQNGRTGKLLEQQVVSSLVTALLAEDTQALPVATRVKLITGLPVATDTVRTLGGRAGTNLAHSAAELRQDLTQQVDSKVGQLSQLQGGLETRLTGVEGSVDGLQTVVQSKAERSDLTTLQGQFIELGKGAQTLTTRLDSLQSHFTKVDEAVGGFRGDLDRLREEVKTGGNLELVTKLQEQLADVTTSLQKFDRRFATFQEKTVAQLEMTLARDEFARFQDELGQQVAKLSERTDAVQTQVGRFDTSLNKLQLDLRDVQEELKRRPGLQIIQELQATLATLANTVTTLNTDVTNVRDQVTLRLTDIVTHTELTQVRTELDRALSTKIDQQLAQSFGDLDSRFRTLQTDVSAFRSNITRLRGDLDTLGTNVLKLRVDVDRLGPRP